MTTFEIHGTLQGELWWPAGVPAQKPTAFAFTREDVPRWPLINRVDTLREAVESLMQQDDGDFAMAAHLTADSYLKVVRRRPGRMIQVRDVPLSMFRSIEDYMTEDYAFAED